MMGFPSGWVCDTLDRNPALRALGNSVVCQQAEVAIRSLLSLNYRVDDDVLIVG